MSQQSQSWNSRVGLILAMAGNAVGIGNFLRFPVQAVQNGGGAFIIPYLVSFVLLGIPLLLVEWSTGKYGGMHGHHSPPMIMQMMNHRKIWRYTGAFGIFSSVIICSYYCYIESWNLSYAIYSVLGVFNGMGETQISDFFAAYLNVSVDNFIPLVSFLFCMCLNIFILSKGISGGIEKVAKFCMPMLFIFGIFLAIKACSLTAGEDGAIFDGTEGLNFLWTPNFDSLDNPKVWLAAAGQIFFTLSLGMGAIQCYASYLQKEDDIALNSMTSGFVNEFTEVIIGGAILIPISVGYLGVDRVVELMQSGGLGLGFKTMPYLFEQWGGVLSALAGLAFFGLLFFASLTSTLALAQPTIGFFSRSYEWTQKKSSIFFGGILLVMALPCILFFDKGVFDEYDYWGGTISLFFFAMIESIAFSWVMGVDKGWRMINDYAELKIPIVFKYVLKYITPTLFIVIFVSALIKPMNDDWSLLSFSGWELDNSAIIAELMHKGVDPNDPSIFYLDMTRILLLIFFVLICVLIWHATRTREENSNKRFTESHQNTLE